MKDTSKNIIVLVDCTGLTKEQHELVVRTVKLKYPECGVLPDFNFEIGDATPNYKYYVCFIERCTLDSVNVTYQSKRHIKRTIANTILKKGF